MGMDSKEVLFVLLDGFADWESAFLATSLSSGVMPGSEVKYTVKTVAPTLKGVRSLGGFYVNPDYEFDTVPQDFAALVLIGGVNWNSPEAERVVPLLTSAMDKGIVVGAICNAVSFMAAHGFLNGVKHTGNTVEQLKLWGGSHYTNESRFIERQAVADKNVVTANGTGYLEFTKEMLVLLHADTEERIAASYAFNKNGFYKID